MGMGMGDVELYAAEVCFVVSLVSAAHTSVIIWDNCDRFLDPAPIFMVIMTFILVYSCVRRLPHCGGPSFKLQYWKYAIFAFTALGNDYNPKVVVFRERLTTFLQGLILFILIAVLIRRRTGTIVNPPATLDQETIVNPPATLDRETLNGVLVVLRENGILMFVRWFIHVNSILILLICVLAALVLMTALEFLRLELMLTVVSILLLVVGFDLRVKIAVPLDVVCFSVCYRTVGSINGLRHPFLIGDPSLILYSIFIMSSTTLLFFLHHLLLVHFYA